MNIKASIVSATKQLSSLLKESQYFETPSDQVHFQSKEYLALGCDLRDLKNLQKIFERHGLQDCAVLFTAEVSLTYMDCESVDALIKWAASFPDARFSILEQFLPSGAEHPFARTMIKHFNSLNTSLQSISTYPLLQDQVNRYSSRGWKSVDACDLLAFWLNQISNEEKERIEKVEGFDEWEEFWLFCQHYFILYAHNGSGTASNVFRKDNTAWNGGEYCNFPTRPVIHRTPSSEDSRVDYEVHAEFVSSPYLKRRFAAVAKNSEGCLVLHGGQGPTTRMRSSVLITNLDRSDGLPGDSGSPSQRMCHTLTTLSPGVLLLAGGRTSPDKPLSDAYIFEYKNRKWRRVQDMPSGRYRHNTVALDEKRVLVFGGRGENNTTIGEWLLWSEIDGWKVLPTIVSPGPVARHSAGMCWTDRNHGVLAGGMNASGHVIDDMWRIELVKDTDNQPAVSAKWSMVNMLSNRSLWKRFGGHMVYIGLGRCLYVGGVSGDGLMKSENEVIECHCDKVTIRPIELGIPLETQPLLIGHTVEYVNYQLLICGGGGVCFSFGSCFNDGVWVLSEGKIEDSWKVAEEGQGIDGSAASNGICAPFEDNLQLPDAIPRDIKKVTISTKQEFEEIVEASEPVLMESVDLGNCVESWTPEYLKQTVGQDRSVVVHAAESSAMSFQHKNFSYKTTSFGDFIDAAFESPNSRLYFRSLSVTKPNSAPAALAEDFPTLAPDFVLPSALTMAIEHQHSSPLRISSAGVGMWVHYDGMANVLCHIRGRKLFRLYPPSDVTRLSFPHGASTSTIRDIFASPSPPGTTPIDIEMKPGDVLFIPPLWLHAAKPLTPCVAVNVFFRSLKQGSYAHGKDVYGNRDMAAYEKGRGQLAKIVKDFKDLPSQVRGFYLERLATELKEAAVSREER
ncbi:leucine carboxyl methyltransferase-like protein 2 [Geopyxis carbonaria]|nr:leucine carboxyl methyltransferase-like protein 2 [Geopyxis carbonaria]